MISISQKSEKALSGNRELHYRIQAQFPDGSEETFTEERILYGGFSLEENSSVDGKFVIGAAVIGKFVFKIDNTDERYNNTDFGRAKIYPEIGIYAEKEIEWIQRGIYFSEPAKFTGSCLQISCLDSMSLLDRPFSQVDIGFPCSLKKLIVNTCKACGVEFIGKISQEYYIVEKRPVDEALSCRAVLSYAAQICCSFVRCTQDGKITFQWYDNVFSELPGAAGGRFDVLDETRYQTGDTLWGGDFHYGNGDTVKKDKFENMSRYHHLYKLMNQDIAQKSITVTGVRVRAKETNERNYFAPYRTKSGCFPVGSAKDGLISFHGNSFIIGHYEGGAQMYIYLDADISIEEECEYSFTWEILLANKDVNGKVIVHVRYESGHEETEANIADKKMNFKIKKNMREAFIRFQIFKNTTSIVNMVSHMKIVNLTRTETVQESVYGKEGYILNVDGNPLIGIEDVGSVAYAIGRKVSGLCFFPMRISVVSEPTLQAGDPVIISDRKGNSIRSFVSMNTFTAGEVQDLECQAETENENFSTNYTEEEKTRADVSQDTRKQIRDYDCRIQEQMNLMLYLFGLHKTKTVEGDTVHYYIHDKETISSSTAAWHLYQAGGKEQFLVSVDGGSTWRPGYDEQGNPTLPLWDIIVGGI